uniref:hypothetical protein n=1 Tax=Salmonella sp. M198 TaxID=3240293 RepID=UPI00352AA522
LSQPPPSVEAALPENLMFVFNPDHKQGFVSRFHVGALKNYMIEYQLELERNRSPDFRHLPSRFHSLFLFESVDDAERYREGHGSHVGTRIL